MQCDICKSNEKLSAFAPMNNFICILMKKLLVYFLYTSFLICCTIAVLQMRNWSVFLKQIHTFPLALGLQGRRLDSRNLPGSSCVFAHAHEL